MNDDEVSFPTQGSSQWDSLAHIGMEEPGVDGVFYSGWSRDAIDDEGAARRSGVDAFARAGIVGLGVLLDIARMVTDGDGPLERTHVIVLDRLGDIEIDAARSDLTDILSPHFRAPKRVVLRFTPAIRTQPPRAFYPAGIHVSVVDQGAS